MSATIAYYGGIVTDGLVLYMDAAKRDSYPGFGTNWNSVARGGLITGSLVNGVNYNSSTGSLQFDGVNDFVNLGNAFNLTGNFSISIFFNSLVWDKTWQALVTKGDTSWRVHRFGNISPAKIAFGTSGLSITDTTSSLSISNNLWYNVACVYDGASKKIYINGSLDSNNSVTGTLTVNSSAIYIGENSQQVSRYFNGLVSQVQIYNRALSASEVLQNYNATKGRFGL